MVSLTSVEFSRGVIKGAPIECKKFLIRLFELSSKIKPRTSSKEVSFNFFKTSLDCKTFNKGVFVLTWDLKKCALIDF